MHVARFLAALSTAAAALSAQDTAARQAEFFAPDEVQRISLEVSADNLRRLHDALPERIYVPATFRWGDVTVQRVGLRYKGNSSSRPHQRHKRSFLVKFNEFVKGQRFLGLRRVALDNGVQFGSVFSERLITDILRELGVRASRSNYARVRLNGEYAGVYVNVERIDKSFLAKHFPEARGTLFKVHDIRPGARLEYLGDDPSAYEEAFDLKAGRKHGDLRNLAELAKGLRDTPDVEVGAFLEKSFALDTFLTQTAVLLLAGAFDQYTGWLPHNYYLFREAKSGRWHYLTWDLDVGFAENAFRRIRVLDGWHAAWPLPSAPRPLLERIIGNASLLARYRARAKQVLESHFRPKELGARLDRLYALIEKDLRDDPFMKGRITVPGDRSYADVVASIKAFITKRYESARAQLASPGERPRPARVARGRPGGGGGPRPGNSTEDAPSELAALRATRRGVELRWKDNADGERAFIVQRADGRTGGWFRNAVGVPGEDVTSATDRNVRPGRTYRYRVFAVRPTARGAAGTGVSNVVTVRVPAR